VPKNQVEFLMWHRLLKTVGPHEVAENVQDRIQVSVVDGLGRRSQKDSGSQKNLSNSAVEVVTLFVIVGPA
jgi:hypothetical protein